MEESRVVSWIFLAIAIGSQNAPIKMEQIKEIADGIDHAVPTQSELKLSVNRLIDWHLIQKVGKGLELTSKGRLEYDNAASQSNILFNIWNQE